MVNSADDRINIELSTSSRVEKVSSYSVVSLASSPKSTRQFDKKIFPYFKIAKTINF